MEINGFDELRNSSSLKNTLYKYNKDKNGTGVFTQVYSQKYKSALNKSK